MKTDNTKNKKDNTKTIGNSDNIENGGTGDQAKNGYTLNAPNCTALHRTPPHGRTSLQE